MPYQTNDDLPGAVKRVLTSDKARSIWRRVFNESMDRGYQEGRAFGAAYAAIESAGYKKGEDGVYIEKADEDLEKVSADTLRAKVEEHNAEHGDKGRVTVDMLRQVYDRGVGAYRTNPQSVRPGVSSPEQWAMARVNNFLRAIRNGRFRSGKHDTDLLPETHPMSTKGVEKADYQGRKVTLNKPFRLPAGSSKKFGVYVKDGDRTKKVTFGDPNMEIRRDDPQARANFRSRHSCDTATDKTSARYWSCRMWESGTSVSEMTKMDDIEKRQISDDVFTTSIEAVQRAQQLGLGLAAHMTEGPDGQVFYMPGATHEDYIDMVSEVGMIGPEGEQVENPAGEMIEAVIEAAINAIIDATMEKSAAKIIKIDDEARIVWGWASVVSIDGKPMIDRQGDIISAEVMTKAADNFMADVRTAKAMHEGGKIGEVIHSFPLTKALGEALGVHSAMEGWIVAMKVHDDSVWSRVKSGELAAFSIGGMGKRNAV
jgi:cation transport regulator ChaB